MRRKIFFTSKLTVSAPDLLYFGLFLSEDDYDGDERDSDESLRLVSGLKSRLMDCKSNGDNIDRVRFRRWIDFIGACLTVE